MNEKVREYLSELGKKGGKKSRRKLTREQSLEMLKIREAKRKLKQQQTKK